MRNLSKVSIRARDISGQQRANARVPTDSTMSEAIDVLLDRMQMPSRDSNGRPLAYQARLNREGRHLHASELVSETLRDDDELTLQPNIDAG